MNSTIFHIGIDDTDSSDGMCTTFLIYKLVQKLLNYEKTIRLIDYPNLIRLNPNIPWKTRGNASLVLRVEARLAEDEIFDICKRMVTRFATSDRANSRLVIFQGEAMPEEILQFSKEALFRVLSRRQAQEIIDIHKMRHFSLRNGQGLVGALAGIGNELRGDHTYELIAYRKSTAEPRIVEKEKIIEMVKRTWPGTFNSYDQENDRVMICPHGPDPVLLGIRGETSRIVRRAFRMLLPIRNLAGSLVFRSNQGTGEHLNTFLDLSNLKAFSSGKVRGIVSSKPRVEMGGHVFFDLQASQRSVSCAAYEPTGRFRNFVQSLETGDEILVAGGVRKATIAHSRVINLEYLVPLHLKRVSVWSNPVCAICGLRMSSEGKGQGFQCRGCGFKTAGVSKTRSFVPRSLLNGRIYLPDMKAQRHLTKPIQRYQEHGDSMSRVEQAIFTKSCLVLA